MTEALIAAVVILAAIIGVLAFALAASTPFLYWRCFRFEDRMDKVRQDLQTQINTLDEALALLNQAVGVPAERRE